MTVVALHPEELLDRLFEGELTQAERERLNQHLAACEVCRFEYAARADFQAEALALAAAGPPPLLPMRSSPVPAAASAPVRRRRSRVLVWGLAAAALISASGAVASVLVAKPSWRAMSRFFSQQSTLSASRPVLPAKAAAPLPTGCKGAECGAASSQATQPVVATPGEREQVPGPRSQVPGEQRAGERRVGARRQLGQAAAVVSRESPVVDVEPKEPVAKEPSTPAKLFGEANQARRSGDVGRASGLYYLLQDQFPGSAEAELSRVTLALLLLDSGDAQGALTSFERYLAGSSRGLEAEALVGRARALGRLGRRDLEVAAWREVQRKYPRSIYGRQATERLSALGQP